MIFTLAVTLLVLLTVYYSWFILRARAGLGQLRAAESSSSPLPSVTVVIAARNESGTIGGCLQAILDQQYSGRLMEIIVVDDHSADGTAEIVRGFSRRNKSVRLLSLQSTADRAAAGKPAAIAAGVEAARGEIIFTTDADCVVPREWIASVVRHFSPDVALVAGPVQVVPGPRLLTQLDHLELFALVTVGAGLIGAGHPIIANGANLAYRKSVFKEVNGFGDGHAWCDDETIMQRIHRRHLGRIEFAPEAAATVTTAPSTSYSSFWKQRLRWSSKGGHYEDIRILLSLVVLYFYFLFLLAVSIVSVLSPSVWVWVLASYAVKIATDIATLLRGRKVLNQSIPAVAFLIAEVFHVPYIVITAALGQFFSFSWKGRTVNT